MKSNIAADEARFPGDLVYDAVITILKDSLEDSWKAHLESPPPTPAISEKYREPLDLLIEHGANVNGTGLSRWPALFEAVQEDQPAVARFLLERGGDLNCVDETGQTAWKLAGNSRMRKEIRALLRQ